jgi:ABC-type amino acid transport substrate-binding protein
MESTAPHATTELENVRHADVSMLIAGTSRLSRRGFLRLVRNGLTVSLPISKPLWASATSTIPTRKPGILRIGTYFVNPPFEFVSHGERIGFEVDLMRDIARRLDLQPEFVDTRWDGIFGQLDNGLYDCIVGGITITPSRQKLLAWSIPYMTTTLSFIIAGARSDAGMTLANLKGATIGVQAATTDYDAAIAMKRAGKIGMVKVYSFAQIDHAMADLTAGHVQAVMKVTPVADWFVQRTPGLRILATVPDDPQPLGIGFNKTSTTLVGDVNRALTQMQGDGTYRILAQRWIL